MAAYYQFSKKTRSEVEYLTLWGCQHCGDNNRLWRHGFYQRQVPRNNQVYELDICRYICPHCRKTVSLLPWFLLPYFQYPRDCILKALREYLHRIPSQGLSRQLTSFYYHRFMRNMNAIIGALRRQDWLEALPENENKKAIRLVNRLETTSPSASTVTIEPVPDRFMTNFMALSLYRK